MYRVCDAILASKRRRRRARTWSHHPHARDPDSRFCRPVRRADARKHQRGRRAHKPKERCHCISRVIRRFRGRARRERGERHGKEHRHRGGDPFFHADGVLS